MSNFSRKEIQVEAVEFELAGLTINGYSAGEINKNGKVINYLSGRGLADCLNLNHSTTVPKRMSKQLKAFLGEGFTPRIGKYKMASGGYSKLNLWTIDAASKYYRYHDRNGNKKASAIIDHLLFGYTTLDEEINRAFAKQKGYIYLFQSEAGLLKIGFSTNYKNRLKQLSRWDGELKPLKIVEANLRTELALHRDLKKYSVRGGEWYPSTAKEVLLSKLEGCQNN